MAKRTKKLKAGIRTYEKIFEQGILPKKSGDWKWLENAYFIEIPEDLLVTEKTPPGTKVQVAVRNGVGTAKVQEGILYRHKENRVDVSLGDEGQVVPVFLDAVALCPVKEEPLPKKRKRKNALTSRATPAKKVKAVAVSKPAKKSEKPVEKPKVAIRKSKTRTIRRTL